MSPTRISIDFSGSPLRVGALLLNKYEVVRGTKGLNLTGGRTATTEELVVAFEDVRYVVKGGYDAAVVVIPNTTSEQNQNNIISLGRDLGLDITQVIREQVAVTAAYIEKVRPKDETTIAIISSTGGVLDVSVITVKVVEEAGTVNYHLVLRDHKVHNEPIDFEENWRESPGGGGLVGAVVKEVVLDPLEKAFQTLETILGGLNIGEVKVEKLVFVGKPETFHALRKAAVKTFRFAEEWEGIDKPEELAAYGAACLSEMGKRLPLSLPDSIADVGPFSPNE